MLAACGGSDESDASDEEQTEADAKDEETEEEELPFYVGTWKYDDYDVIVDMGADGHWTSYDAEGNPTFTGTIEEEDNGVTLNYDDGGDPNFFMATSDGKLVDQDGSKLSRYEQKAAAAGGSGTAPSVEDPLTEVAFFPGKFENFSINYPATMKTEPRTDLANSLDVNVIGCQGTDDFYATSMITFQPLVDVDRFLGQGSTLAKKAMGFLLENYVNGIYGSHLINMIGTDFEDHGSYYSIKGYMWFSGEVYQEDIDTPVRGVTEMRYFGPTGYGMFATTIAPESVIEKYATITENMLETCTYKTDWSTAPKTVPKQPGKAKGKTKQVTKKKKSGASGDTGDYGTAYYWEDADGDIWYWNGYSNEFVAYGTNGYIDDDGEYYESNDAGWNYDYDDSYYVDDYDIYSDPGDGNDAWSDPGDYSDVGDTDWSDPGDYGDDDYDYGGYDDYGDDW